MTEKQQAQGVNVGVKTEGANVVLLFNTEGLGTLPINMEPQAAFELAESMARAAHFARFGKEVQSDESYIAEQARARATETIRMMLTQRLSIMLNSMREDRAWSNGRLAQEIIDVVLKRLT